MVHPIHNGERFELTSPTEMPRAAGFLWNRKMMIQMTCRGYAAERFRTGSNDQGNPTIPDKTTTQPAPTKRMKGLWLQEVAHVAVGAVLRMVHLHLR